MAENWKSAKDGTRGISFDFRNSRNIIFMEINYIENGQGSKRCNRANAFKNIVFSRN
jgi:hypothetical protein